MVYCYNYYCFVFLKNPGTEEEMATMAVCVEALLSPWKHPELHKIT